MERIVSIAVPPEDLSTHLHALCNFHMKMTRQTQHIPESGMMVREVRWRSGGEEGWGMESGGALRQGAPDLLAWDAALGLPVFRILERYQVFGSAGE